MNIAGTFQLVSTTHLLLATLLSHIGHILVNAQVSSSCEAQCQGTFNYYNNFVRSAALVQYYRRSCLSRCYNQGINNVNFGGPRRTTTTTTTTTTRAPYIPPTFNIVPPSTVGNYPVAPIPSSPSCGIQSRNQYRVIGGRQAEECEFPWVVGILSRNFWCGGSILDRRHILSAAHCFRDRDTGAIFQASEVSVRVGSSTVHLQSSYSVARVNLNPRHVQFVNDYDVAVLTLTNDLAFSDCVAPICLPNEGDSAFDAAICMSAGWGVTQDSETRPPNRLRTVTLPLVPQHLCLDVYGARYINDLKMCAGDLANGGVDTCRGDSGGPLMCVSQGRYSVYGIVSFGSVCGAPNRPGIYTNVANREILSFIRSALNDV